MPAIEHDEKLIQSIKCLAEEWEFHVGQAYHYQEIKDVVIALIVRHWVPGGAIFDLWVLPEGSTKKTDMYLAQTIHLGCNTVYVAYQ